MRFFGKALIRERIKQIFVGHGGGGWIESV